MDSLLLPGTIEGLLKRGCPVRVRMSRNGDDDWYPAIYLGSPHEDNTDAGDAVLMLDADLEEDVYGWASVMSSGMAFVALDLRDPAGVDRAARWLAERTGIPSSPAWRYHKVLAGWCLGQVRIRPGCSLATGRRTGAPRVNGATGSPLATPRRSTNCARLRRLPSRAVCATSDTATKA